MKIANQILFTMMIVLALFLFSTTIIYFSFKPDVNFLLTKQHLVSKPVWRAVFYFHILAGMYAIAAGPFQFMKRIRNKNLALHKKTGKLYVYAILVIGAPTGLYMAFFATGGWPATFGFIFMSLAWFYTTLMGVLKVLQGDIVKHQQWMIRSYAVTFSAVTLRLLVPLLSLTTSASHLQIVIVTAWSSWMLNLFISELIIFNLKYKTIIT